LHNFVSPPLLSVQGEGDIEKRNLRTNSRRILWKGLFFFSLLIHHFLISCLFCLIRLSPPFSSLLRS
jgi:hypothetical protein